MLKSLRQGSRSASPWRTSHLTGADRPRTGHLGGTSRPLLLPTPACVTRATVGSPGSVLRITGAAQGGWSRTR